jgi:hypothetical protein
VSNSAGGGTTNKDDDPFEGLVLDSAFVRGAQQKEPSARARMLTEKWREEPPVDPKFAWRDGAPTQQRPRTKKKTKSVSYAGPARKDRTGLIALGITVLAAVLLFGSSLTGMFSGGGDDNNSSDPGPRVLPPANAAAPERISRTDPFAGSPALGYADNGAGIVLPAASPVPGYTAAEVQRALEATRDLLKAGNLDPAAVRGGQPADYLNLLDPDNNEDERLRTALKTPTPESHPQMWVTRFDPAEAAVVGAVVKVNGAMSYTVEEGVLTVRADYSFVYPVARADRPESLTRVVVRRDLATRLYKGPQWTPTEPGRISLLQSNVRTSGVACGRHDAYTHPDFARTGGSGEASDPYDRSRPVDATGVCGVASRV